MLTEFRCARCNKLLGKYRECLELEITCPRCGLSNHLHHKPSSITTESKYSAYRPAVVKSQALTNPYITNR
ncbi:MAG: Com family DNA-binding transcriptional regulator [Firmicutes bacterium]|nr:Com family DNA-binding transcriptional regulator [Bacillota bacterium]